MIDGLPWPVGLGTAGASTIYLEPFNTAPRNLTDVIAAA